MTVFVTGAAGFIGFHVSKNLLMKGRTVIGLDNLNNYYDRNLKLARLNLLREASQEYGSCFHFIEADIENDKAIFEVFHQYKPENVINLAAQAGVRYSILNPRAYLQSNLLGFGNLLEACRKHQVKHLVYASSSSVYGGNTKLPFSEKDGVDHPVSLYAASKKANELMAHSYSHLYNIPSTGLRFFTVYGPWGRPDMALFLFTKAMLNNEPIKVFNNGLMKRDFTYIDDISESIIRILDKPAIPNDKFNTSKPDPSTSWAPYRIFNIGNSNSVSLMAYIEAIEEALGVQAKKEFQPMQPGDVPATSSDTRNLEDWVGFRPSTPIKEGVGKFVTWYKNMYKV